jgi:hypothetical protein
MKKLLIVILLLLMVWGLSPAQTKYNPGKSTIASIAIQGMIPGIGVRIDQFFQDNIGVYGLFTHGYKNLPVDGRIGSINKYSIGYITYLHQKVNNDLFNTFCVGINYQTYENRYIPNPQLLNQSIFNHWSFDLGVGGGINNFSMSFTYDIIKSEAGVYFGFRFH